MKTDSNASITALDHVGFTVADLDRSVAWYSLLLGDGPMLRRTWEPGYVGEILAYPDCSIECAFWQLPGGIVLELIEYLAPPSARVELEPSNVGDGHLCLVTEDLDADYRRLAGDTVFRCEHPVEIPYGPYRGGKACYLSDPDGISIQLLQHPPGGPRFESDDAS